VRDNKYLHSRTQRLNDLDGLLPFLNPLLSFQDLLQFSFLSLLLRRQLASLIELFHLCFRLRMLSGKWHLSESRLYNWSALKIQSNENGVVAFRDQGMRTKLPACIGFCVSMDLVPLPFRMSLYSQGVRIEPRLIVWPECLDLLLDPKR